MFLNFFGNSDWQIYTLTILNTFCLWIVIYYGISNGHLASKCGGEHKVFGAILSLGVKDNRHTEINFKVLTVNVIYLN